MIDQINIIIINYQIYISLLSLSYLIPSTFQGINDSLLLAYQQHNKKISPDSSLLVKSTEKSGRMGSGISCYMVINYDSSRNIRQVERYRPKTISDCILSEDLKHTFTEFVKKKELPNLLLSGTAGTGKTTVARALCEELGCDYIMINGSDEGRHIDTLRTQIKNFASTISLTETSNHKVVIVDEADYMNPDSVQRS